MKTFELLGTIVDTDSEKQSFEDTTPAQVSSFIKKLEPKEEVCFNINSCGGSVTAGISIANMIRQASKNGHKTTAKVNGIAASIASVILCACDNIILSDASFVMIHRPWTIVQGNSIEMRKEAEVMDKMMEAMLSFYRTKFDLTDEELIELMNEETWFSGSEAKNFKLHCEVYHDEDQIQIAACVNKMKKMNYTKIPSNLTMEKKEIQEQVEATINEENKVVEANATPMNQLVEQVEETKVVEANATPIEDTIVVAAEDDTTTPFEQDKEDDSTIEGLKARIEALTKENEELKQKLEEANNDERCVTKQEVEARVSGMQSKMAKQIDALKNEAEAKYQDFTTQLKVKDEELIKAKGEITSLIQKLEEADKELSTMTSAFEAKNNALAKLNAGVNEQAEELPTMNEGLKKCKTPAERVAFLMAGKFVR